jgi:5-methylthioadenosine/S-adenosylhomocysteine deaminase
VSNAGTVIRNAIVMEPKIGEHLDIDVLIDGEKIAAVRPNIAPVGGHEIDGKDMIVMPGFVDTHRHIWQSLLRNTANDWSLLNTSAGVRGVDGRTRYAR